MPHISHTPVRAQKSAPLPRLYNLTQLNQESRDHSISIRNHHRLLILLSIISTCPMFNPQCNQLPNTASRAFQRQSETLPCHHPPRSQCRTTKRPSLPQWIKCRRKKSNRQCDPTKRKSKSSKSLRLRLHPSRPLASATLRLSPFRTFHIND